MRSPDQNGHRDWNPSRCSHLKTNAPLSPNGDKGANLCGTTPIPHNNDAALVRAVTGTPGGAYLLSRWVRSSQGMFAGAAPPPSHHAGGSLRGGLPGTRPDRSLAVLIPPPPEAGEECDMLFPRPPRRADAIYSIVKTGICQPFSEEKLHKNPGDGPVTGKGSPWAARCRRPGTGRPRPRCRCGR